MAQTFRPLRLVFVMVALLLPCHALMAQTLDQRLVRERAAVAPPLVLAPSQLLVDEIEPNNDATEAQTLAEVSPITVDGAVEVGDVGAFTINFQGGLTDDIEDLYRLTTTEAGLEITLSGLSADCDLYLIAESDITDTSFSTVASSLQIGLADETITGTDEDGSPLPPDTYFIGVAIFDPDPIAQQTTYTLTVTGAIATPVERLADVPSAFALSPNYPNPFNPETRIDYHLAEAASVHLEVFDPLGRRIRTLVATQQAAGTYAVRWDGRTETGLEAPTGLYVYRLRAGSFRQSRTMVLLR